MAVNRFSGFFSTNCPKNHTETNEKEDNSKNKYINQPSIYVMTKKINKSLNIIIGSEDKKNNENCIVILKPQNLSKSKEKIS